MGSQSGLTSLTFKRLSMLKPSAITSRFKRSVTENFREIRKSIWKKPGRVKALRARLPTQPNGGDGTVKSVGKGLFVGPRHSVGIVKSKPFTKGELTTGKPAGTFPEGNTSGRLVAVPRSRLGFVPIRML